MNINSFPILSHIFQNSKTKNDFNESHSIWKSDRCEVFFTEINEEVYQVPVAFSNPIFSNLHQGHKKVQIDSENAVAFDQNQTLILPGNSTVKIDFPNSSPKQLTQCTTISIPPEYIKEKIQLLNETTPHLDHEWQLKLHAHSLAENTKINKVFQMLTFDLLGPKKNLKNNWEDLYIDKLLTKVMQQQNREVTVLPSKKTPSLMQSLVSFIKENPEKSGNINQLCNQACMSPSTLYRYFKRELGISPIEFIIQQKLSKAKDMLTSPFVPIKEVSYLSGFEDSNYFIRLFKKYEGITPKQYQQLFSKEY